MQCKIRTSDFGEAKFRVCSKAGKLHVNLQQNEIEKLSKCQGRLNTRYLEILYSAVLQARAFEWRQLDRMTKVATLQILRSCANQIVCANVQLQICKCFQFHESWQNVGLFSVATLGTTPTSMLSPTSWESNIALSKQFKTSMKSIIKKDFKKEIVI